MDEDSETSGLATALAGLMETNSSAADPANPSALGFESSQDEVILYSNLTSGEQDMIVNVTREYPSDYATVMFGYMMPFVLILTLITNTLVVMVLAQKHMRTPTNIVLFTMAIVDLMTLLSPSPWYFYIYTLGFHDKFLHPPAACYTHHIMTDVIPIFFHTSSIWLALLLASQRYIYVCHPTLARTWCTVPRVKRAILIILFVALLHQFTRFFDNSFTSVTVQYDQQRHLACKNEISEWVQRFDIALYYTTYFTFRILFVFIIPCVALITLNYLLFRALRRAENRRTELLGTRFDRFPSRSHQCSVGAFDQTREQSFANRREPECVTSCENSDIHWHYSFMRQTDAEGAPDANGPDGDQVLAADGEGQRRDCDSGHSSSRSSSCSASSAGSSSARVRPNAREGDHDDEPEGDERCPEEESSCCECASYGGRLEEPAECPSCAHGRRGGATAASARDADQNHQLVSQCSSLLGGGATTTTVTNDDNSSCFAGRSLAQVADTETLEALDATLGGLALHHALNKSFESAAKTEASGAAKLMAQSSSVDSRLACAGRCEPRSRSLRRLRLTPHPGRSCAECCGYRPRRCNNTPASPSSDAHSDAPPDGASSGRAETHAEGGGAPAKSTLCAPDYGNDAAGARDAPKRPRRARPRGGKHASVPTTTTTVHSHSNGSLVQAREPAARLQSPSVGGGGGGAANMRSMDSNRTTLMLIVVVTVFLLVEVPVAVVTIAHVVLNTFEVFKDVDFSSWNYIKLFTNFFIMISYSVNFTIYCSMSKKFRETFRDLVLCGKGAREPRTSQQREHSAWQQQQSHSQKQPTPATPDQKRELAASPRELEAERPAQLECEL